jgi:hypothetical protein
MRRSVRNHVVTASVALLTAMVVAGPPVAAHVTKKVKHTWKHLQPLADARYELKGTPAQWAQIQGVPAGFADGVDNEGSGPATDVTCTACISVNELDFDPATQGELNTHAGSGDHDARYYTKVELTVPDGTPPNLGFNRVHWDNLNGVPGGFADGTDDSGAPAWLLAGNAGTNPATQFLGTSDNQALNIRVNNVRAFRLEPNGTNAANVIGGFSGNSVTAGVVGATISGGGESIGGANAVTDRGGTVGGGAQNQAGDATGTTTDRPFATVAGGFDNTASGTQATVSGGVSNTASGTAATVNGGVSNTASGISATVSGGIANTASGTEATVGGGDSNTASGTNATLAGGVNNAVTDDFTTVSGGQGNRAGDNAGTTADETFGTVGGGFGNIASGQAATVGGGFGNTASGDSATVGGGSSNTASGDSAAVMGGSANIASGTVSAAAGAGAMADDHGAFVWSDSCNNAAGSAQCPTVGLVPFASTAVDQFSARATGGVRFVTAVNASGTPTAGATLAAGASSWGTVSDRASKENVAPVDGEAILERLSEIPVATWNWKTQDDSIRHIGPMAQDFHSAFEVGEDEKHISTVDADGVALAAIQGLNDKVASLEERLNGGSVTEIGDYGPVWQVLAVLGLSVGIALGGREVRRFGLP